VAAEVLIHIGKHIAATYGIDAVDPALLVSSTSWRPPRCTSSCPLPGRKNDNISLLLI
jgi:hypothetical protein